MQGDVVVESTPGSGSEFTFTFEAGTAQVDTIAHAVASRHDTDELSARSTLSQQLRHLPPTLIEQFREAALEGRATGSYRSPIRSGNTGRVSAVIRALARDFEYDSLVSALQPVARDDGKVPDQSGRPTGQRTCRRRHAGKPAAPVRVARGTGYEVRAVTNGRQAIQAVEREPPDLILLDINMPELNGYEVSRHLRALERSKDIP